MVVRDLPEPCEGAPFFMAKDLSPILQDFSTEPGSVRARKITTEDGRTFLQLRMDLGILQMTLEGRPDGTQPGGYASMLESIRTRLAETQGPVELSQQELGELVREMLQYYRRRISYMALAKQAQNDHNLEEADEAYRGAIADAEHNLAILDFFGRSHIDLDMVEEQEQYRPFIMMHRAVCQAERALLYQDPDAAIEYLQETSQQIREAVEDTQEEDEVDPRPFLHELRQFEKQIRKNYRRKRTLREQLQDAIAKEDFERAARLRDALAERARHRRV